MSIRVVDRGITLRLFHTEQEARKAIGAHAAISFCGGWLAKNGAGRWLDDGGFLPESWVPPHQIQASDNCQKKVIPKLSEAQRRVLKWVGKGWHGQPGSGSAVMVNGARICNVDTMSTLRRLGYVSQDGSGCWHATDAGKTITKELGL